MSLGDARLLRTLTLVLDLGSISAAATVLGYTQSAVSQQLATLERELGSMLVDRSRRPFRPTPAGAALRPDVDRILAAVTAAESTLQGVQAGAPRRLRLAAFPSALASFVPTAMRELRRSEPELVVQVLQHETREALEVLRQGGADVAVVHHLPTVPSPGVAGDMRRQVLLEDPLRVVLPRRHRLAAREIVHLSELEAEPLLVPRRDTPAGRFRSLVEHLCAQAGFAPRVAYEVDDLVGAQAFAAAGIAVVLMHQLTVHTPLPGVTIRPLAESTAASRTIEAMLPAHRDSTPAKALVAHLARAAHALTSPDANSTTRFTAQRANPQA
ncbi:MAG: LysR family transcriptional regulator [Solirubrobacterales bacterium]|nr:LysR family transcriptional regulator [Solirubrobacterales bacterium]